MIGNRLKALREERMLTQKDLAQIFGVTPKAISFYELGERQPPNELLLKLSRYFGVSTDYLLGASSDPKPRKTVRIPVLGRVAAGIPFEAIQDIEDWEEIDEADGDPREYFALTIKGHSMEPDIKDGSRVIVHKQSDVDSGDIAVVLVNGDEATVKKVVKRKDGIMLVAFNPSVYLPRFYSCKEVRELPVRIIGRVMESRRKW